MRRLTPKGRNCANFKNGSHHKMREKGVQNHRLPEPQISPARNPCGSISSVDDCEESSKEGSRARLSKSASGASPQEEGNAVPDALLHCDRLIATPLAKRRVFSLFEVSPLGVVALRGGVWEESTLAAVDD
jgi:hypothetical protein